MTKVDMGDMLNPGGQKLDLKMVYYCKYLLSTCPLENRDLYSHRS